MRKYRVLFKGGAYYPQIRGLFWWKNFYLVRWEEDYDGIRETKVKVKYWFEEPAISFAKEQEVKAAKESEVKKSPEVVWSSEHGEPNFLIRVAHYFYGGW